MQTGRINNIVAMPMISEELFNNMRTRYGDVASWAVWEEAGEKPKSNMGYQNIFDLQKNPSLLGMLNNNVIMVGLNFSRPIEPVEPFMNFHDLSPHAQDYKIRYAFTGTEFYGAYMTDIIKNVPMRDSRELRTYLKTNPSIVQEHISLFRRELNDLEANQPMLLAFGRDAYKLLSDNLLKSEYSTLIQLTHYSHQISKEDYKDKVLKQIADVMDCQ